MQPGRRAHPARRLNSLGAGLSSLLLALVILSTPATAQNDPFGVAITAEPTTASTDSEDVCNDFVFTVRNSSTSPTGGSHSVTITTTPAPAGWRYGREPESPLTIAQGGSQQVTLSVCPVTDQVREGAAAVTVTATLENGLDGSLDPTGTTVPPNPQQSVTVQSSFEEVGVLGIEVPNGALYLLAAVLAALVAVILLSRRRIRHGVTLICPEAEKRVHPGRGTSFPIRIRNEGGERDVVHLRVDPLPPGWESFIPVTDLSLDPGEEQTVWLSVRSPRDAQGGGSAPVRITASSRSAPNEQAILEARAVVTDAPAPVSSERGVFEDDDDGDDEVELILPDEAALEVEQRPVAVRRPKS